MASPGSQAAGKANGANAAASHTAGGGNQGGSSGRPGGVGNQGQTNTDRIENDPSNRATFGSKSQNDALKLAQAQRKLLAPGMQIAETIIGAIPTPAGYLGGMLKVGNWMGKKAEDALGAEPNSIRTNPNDPSAISGMTSGGFMSNRDAQDTPGFDSGSGNPNSSNTAYQNLLDMEEENKKKQAAATLSPVSSSPTTLLGSPIDTLGSPKSIS